MSRRRGETDPGVGSDSFLDVLANIVGILIILIVVAGVRVSRAPVVVPSPEPTAAPAAVDIAPPAELPPETEAVPEARLASNVEVPPAAEAVPAAVVPPTVERVFAKQPPVPARIDPSPELLERIADLERELTGLSTRSVATRQQVAVADQSRREREGQLAAVDAALAAELSQHAAERQRLSAFERDLESAAAVLERRRRVLAEAESQQPDVQPIRHRLTAVSYAVQGPEMHFHLQRGRVAYVPVDELVELLKSDISRQKDWLARVPRHEGRVGPIGGFSMAYVVERQSMSIVDELRVGGAVRIAVSEWRIIPEADFPAESAAAALAPGSAFIRRLKTTGLDTALTFWVYPDSFPEFRQLQELARSEGFTVAARPLPEGTPLAASPQGTRSAGQ